MGFAKFDVKNELKNKGAVGTERTKYFDGVGTDVSEVTSLDYAIKKAGLDFEVVKLPVYYPINGEMEMKKIENQFTTVRTDTMEPLGVVGKNYEILQNIDAFQFLESMVADGEARFETAGSYGPGGAKSFITMSTEPMNILGDEFKPYILITNSFDGSGSVRVMFTPIRIFCSNCIARAIKTAENKISVKHSSRLEVNLRAGREILLGNSNYMEAIKQEAETMAKLSLSEDKFKEIVNAMFGVSDAEKATETAKFRAEETINQIMKAYNQDDLQNFNNTAYKAYQAFADFESHMPTFRATETLKYKNITNVMKGMPILNEATKRIMAMAS